MKKLLLVLAAIGLMNVDTNAQTKKKKSKYDKNYKICLVDDTYLVCDKQCKPVQTSKTAKTDAIDNHEDGSLRMLNTQEFTGYSNREPQRARQNSRIRVSYDDPNAPYQGDESMINDGVEKNKDRNINYLNNGADLPPNDGQ